MNETSELVAVPSLRILHGVNVVELSRHVAGSYCGRILAQLGASVSRFGVAVDAMGSVRTLEVMQRVLHAGKRVLPLDKAAIQAALRNAHIVIAEKSDRDDELAQYVEDIVRHRSGLGANAVLVVLSASGSTDGYAAGSGFTSGASGAMSWVIGEPNREPLSLPYDIVDYEAGASAAAAGLITMLANAGAVCRMVDVSSRDVISHFVSMIAQNYLPYERPWRRDGRRPYQSGGIYPLGLFACKDGYIAIFCRGDLEWQGILRAMENPEWSRDERFKDPRVIARNYIEEADEHFLPWLAQHTKAEILTLSLKFGFAAAPVRLVSETLEDSQFAFRGSLKPFALEDGTTIKVPVEPWRLHEDATAASPQAMLAAKPWPVAKAKAPTPSTFLKGLRVLDFSWVWSGPLVSSFLTDLGAEVIKIEHPSRLDSVRQRGRPSRDSKPIEGPVVELNPWFNQLNHGKRSVLLDIKTPEGQSTIHKLAATCDVVVENMRPGVLGKLNLGYADLVKHNPSIVMLSMSLAGQAGPLCRMMGYAGIMSSMAGLESLVGYVEPDGSQTRSGMVKTGLGDPNAATHAICVLAAALHRRKITGRGLWIDLSQMDAILSVLLGPLIESQLIGEAPVMGNRHTHYVPHGHFACLGEEKWVALSIQTERQWTQLLAAAKDPALSRFAGLDAGGRLRQRLEIEQAMESWTRRRTRDDIVAILAVAGVPVAPVASYEDMRDSSWRKRRGLTRAVDHPYLSRQEIVVPPWRFGDQSAGVDRPAPLLGADTDDVLAALNIAVGTN